MRHKANIAVLLLGNLLGAILMPTLAFAASPSPSLSPSFQSKVAMINKIPFQKVTVGDINIAYKQLGKSNAKPIILITGLGATMDMWNPLLLEHLISSNYSVTIFDNRGA